MSKTFLKTGTEKIEERNFRDFNFKIKGFTYDVEANEFQIELLIWEKEYVHSRFIRVTALGAWVDNMNAKIEAAVLGKKQFSGATEI